MQEEELALQISSDDDSIELTPAHYPPRKQSHAIMHFSGDGEPDMIEADEIHYCLPTQQCIQFWVTICTCLAAVVFSAVMMIVQGIESPLFYLWEAIFAVAWGVLVPGPNYSTAFKKPINRDGAPV